MKRIPAKFFLSFLIISNMLSCGKKPDYPKSNINLVGKPLSVIQKNITGKWKLQYVYGGYSPTTYKAKYNAYTVFSSDHITKGDDSVGIYLDTTLFWIKTLGDNNDSIYAFSYYLPGYSIPNNKLVLEIRNDTLEIRDLTSDALFYYYTRW